MGPTTEQLLRDLHALKQENARLKGVEAELAAAIESLRASEERLRLAMAEGVGALARPISGFASDRLFGGRRTPVFIGFAVIASAMCLLLGLAGPHLGWLLYPIVFVLGIGAIGFGGLYLTLLSEFGGRGGAAKAAALGSTIGASGSIIGPPAFGHIVDITGSYDLAWLSLALVGAVCVTLLSLVRESERKI